MHVGEQPAPRETTREPKMKKKAPSHGAKKRTPLLYLTTAHIACGLGPGGWRSRTQYTLTASKVARHVYESGDEG